MIPRFIGFFCFLSILTAEAFSPQLNIIQPRGGQLGKEVKVTFHGDRLFEPQDILFYQKGITFKELVKGKDQKSVKATFVIAPDAALGEHNMRLRCKSGFSYVRSFWVGQFPTVDEAKTKDRKRDLNDSFDEPQDVSQNVTIHGTALNEDADYYRVQAKKGQRLSVEVEGLRLGRELFDPYVAILNSQRFEIAANDDHPLLKRDCATSIIIPEDGAYTILIRESAYQGKSTYQYRLHIGDFPRPVSVFPPAAKPGENIKLSFIGDSSGTIKQQVTIPAKDFSVNVESGIKCPSGIPLRVSNLPYLNEVEPNGHRKEANPKENPPAAPVAFQGILSEEKDQDFFRFTAKKGQNFRVQVHARSLRSPVDSVIQIRKAKDYAHIATNDDQSQGTPDSRLDFKAPEDGEYIIFIHDQLNRSGPDYTYRIEIANREPSLSLSLPPADRNDNQKYKMVNVPRGNRLLLVPNITRANIGCDVSLSASQLPAGIKMEASVAPRNTNNLPILFEATTDAPIGGQLCTITAKDPKDGLTGPFLDKVDVVAINNLGTFVTFNDKRLAIAVTEEAPFKLNLSIPPVPLVKRGTINLKVTAEKTEGFDEKIRLTVPWKPPGVNAPNSVDIPKGKNEVIVTLNANGDAPVGDWKVAVTGTANAPKGLGEVRVSSNLHALKVDEPFLSIALEMAATQPGQNTQMVAKIEQLKPFSGEADLTVHALPHGTSSTPQKIKSNTKEFAIPLTVTDEARKGKHGNIFCQVIIKRNGHPIAHSVGHGGVLRIDPPPPAPKKKAPEAPKKKEVAKKEEPKKAAPKKALSRLEQLRQSKK